MLTIEGNIVKTNTIFRGRIEIDESGIIHKIGEPKGDADFIFRDELIFPGFIDLHVHAREDTSHAEDYKEDFESAGEAAIHGGVTAFAEMPNNPVPPITDASYEAKSELTKTSAVPVLLYAGIGPNTVPLSKKLPYKVFMGKSVGDLFFTSLAEIESVVRNYQGQWVSFHCEDPKILEANKQAPTHEAQRPPEAEISAIDFALELIEKYDLNGKICHCSTLEGMQKIIDAKRRGVKVTAEVTPHHLYFDETMLEGKEKDFQVNPPIRQTKENRLGLIAMLKGGDIDYLATDHAPHTIEEKSAGISGLPHLDTYGPFTAWLMQEYDFTPGEISRVCAENPGGFLNNFFENTYGKIEEGYVGSLTVIDVGTPYTVGKKALKTKCGWSPFEGVTFPGSVPLVIIKGKPHRDNNFPSVI